MLTDAAAAFYRNLPSKRWPSTLQRHPVCASRRPQSLGWLPPGLWTVAIDCLGQQQGVWNFPGQYLTGISTLPDGLLKLDIEGGEFLLLPRLVGLGVLCRLSSAVIEYHAEQNPAWLPLMVAADSAPRQFEKNIKYLMAHAGKGCNVVVNGLSAHAGGSR